MNIGFATDHGGYILKEPILEALQASGHTVRDFGAYELNPNDDFPDFVIHMAGAVGRGEVTRGLAICDSGVGACIAANKVAGARAALIADSFSAHQGVEDDNMNVLRLGGQVTGHALAWDLVQEFLSAHFKDLERFRRRLAKISVSENKVSAQ